MATHQWTFCKTLVFLAFKTMGAQLGALYGKIDCTTPMSRRLLPSFDPLMFGMSGANITRYVFADVACRCVLNIILLFSSGCWGNFKTIPTRSPTYAALRTLQPESCLSLDRDPDYECLWRRYQKRRLCVPVLHSLSFLRLEFCSHTRDLSTPEPVGVSEVVSDIPQEWL